MKRKVMDDPPAPAAVLPPEITHHPFHPGHELKLVTGDEVEFDCDGCKQPGKGARYTCGHDHDAAGEERRRPRCDFDLHTCCALAAEVLKYHALFPGRAFVLLHEPPPDDGVACCDAYSESPRFCDACGDTVSGFVYHCFDGDLDLHPCCALLPGQIDLDGFAFQLCNGKAPRRCCVCPPEKGERRRRGRCRSKFWSYRSDCDGEAVFVHVACFRDLAMNENLKTPRVDKMVQARDPVLNGVLQKKAKTSTKVKRFIEIVGFLARVIIGIIFGDPTAMVVAVAGLVFNNG